MDELTADEQNVQRTRPRFYALLMALGKNDAERARALHVQRMTVSKYRRGKASPRRLLLGGWPGSPMRPTTDPEVLRNRAAIAEAYAEDERAERDADEPAQADEPATTPDEPVLLAA